jgi:hypothetical protein
MCATHPHRLLGAGPWNEWASSAPTQLLRKVKYVGRLGIFISLLHGLPPSRPAYAQDGRVLPSGDLVVELVVGVLHHPGRIGSAQLGFHAPRTYNATLSQEVMFGGRVAYSLDGQWNAWLTGALAPRTRVIVAEARDPDAESSAATSSVAGRSYLLSSGLSRALYSNGYLEIRTYAGVGLSIYRGLPDTVICDEARPGDGLCGAQRMAKDQTQRAVEAGVRVRRLLVPLPISFALGLRLSRYQSEVGGAEVRADGQVAVGLRIHQ